MISLFLCILIFTAQLKLGFHIPFAPSFTSVICCHQCRMIFKLIHASPILPTLLLSFPSLMLLVLTSWYVPFTPCCNPCNIYRGSIIIGIMWFFPLLLPLSFLTFFPYSYCCWNPSKSCLLLRNPNSSPCCNPSRYHGFIIIGFMCLFRFASLSFLTFFFSFSYCYRFSWDRGT